MGLEWADEQTLRWPIQDLQPWANRAASDGPMKGQCIRAIWASDKSSSSAASSSGTTTLEKMLTKQSTETPNLQAMIKSFENKLSTMASQDNSRTLTAVKMVNFTSCVFCHYENMSVHYTTLVNVKALELVATNWCSLNYALE